MTPDEILAPIIEDLNWQANSGKQLSAAALLASVEKCKANITAAVASERDACAKATRKAIMNVNTATKAMRDMGMADMRDICADKAEAAINARTDHGA